jgi:DNA-binding MarR family transcriptional regulator
LQKSIRVYTLIIMGDDVDFAECRQCLCLAARVEAQRLTRMFDERLRPFDLTINQFTLLATLVIGGPQAVTRLAARLGIDRTTLTRNLSLAERRGLVTHRPGEDSRERLIEITAAGRELATSAFPAWQAAQQQAKAS